NRIQSIDDLLESTVLEEVALRTQVHRLIEEVPVLVHCEEHDRCFDFAFVKLRRYFESASLRHVDVENSDLRPVLADQLKGLRPIRGFSHHTVLRVSFDDLPQSLANQCVVVGNNDSNLTHMH